MVRPTVGVYFASAVSPMATLEQLVASQIGSTICILLTDILRRNASTNQRIARETARAFPFGATFHADLRQGQAIGPRRRAVLVIGAFNATAVPAFANACAVGAMVVLVTDNAPTRRRIAQGRLTQAVVIEEAVDAAIVLAVASTAAAAILVEDARHA